MPRAAGHRSPTRARAGEDLVRRFGVELRIARVAAGLSQARMATLAGLSQTTVSAVERGDRRPNWDVAAGLAAATGHQLSLKLYPVQTIALRDSGQLGVAQRILEALHPAWHAELEAPIPGPGLRAADLLLRGPDIVVQVEIERRLVDFQAQLRSAQIKRRDLAALEDRPVRLVLALPESRSTRAVLLENASLVQRTLPITSRELWLGLRHAEPVNGDGVLLVPRPRALPALVGNDHHSGAKSVVNSRTTGIGVGNRPPGSRRTPPVG